MGHHDGVHNSIRWVRASLPHVLDTIANEHHYLVFIDGDGADVYGVWSGSDLKRNMIRGDIPVPFFAEIHDPRTLDPGSEHAPRNV